MTVHHKPTLTDGQKRALIVGCVILLIYLLLRKRSGSTVIRQGAPLNVSTFPTFNTYELPALPDMDFDPFKDAGLFFNLPTFNPDKYDFGDFNLPNVKMGDLNVTINPNLITYGIDKDGGESPWQSTNLICDCQDEGYHEQVYVQVQQPEPPPIIQYGFVDRTRVVTQIEYVPRKWHWALTPGRAPTEADRIWD